MCCLQSAGGASCHARGQLILAAIHAVLLAAVQIERRQALLLRDLLALCVATGGDEKAKLLLATRSGSPHKLALRAQSGSSGCSSSASASACR
jgi:hypothetical protein